MGFFSDLFPGGGKPFSPEGLSNMTYISPIERDINRLLAGESTKFETIADVLRYYLYQMYSVGTSQKQMSSLLSPPPDSAFGGSGFGTGLDSGFHPGPNPGLDLTKIEMIVAYLEKEINAYLDGETSKYSSLSDLLAKNLYFFTSGVI